MPQYLTRKDNTYYYRQSVPAELRPIIGKREIKKSLGRDYPAAVRECKRYAVVADTLIANARADYDATGVDPFSRQGIKRTKFVVLTSVTPELEAQIRNLMRAALLETDRETRISLRGDRDASLEYGEHINQGLQALRRQLATGNTQPMIDSARVFLVGRGYQPEFSEDDWHRIAYVMTEANVDAYEQMSARQEGKSVSTGDSGEILPSQFEIQNAPRRPPDVTWQQLYDVWSKTIELDHTKAAYLAAMKLFRDFSRKEPQAVTREDVLLFRDFLRYEKGLAPGTVANKIGFVGTLVSAGRDSAEHAKFLPHNPFERIKVKRAMRGKSGERRLPFNDVELKKIFSSSIYSEHYRPRGGCGEAAAWIPAIAYLTGMRLEEIATLHMRQFQVDAYDNHYIQVADGKNSNSADREVPIHPALIAAGLIDYVKTCNGRLFPEVNSTDEKKSKAFSKWFGRHLSTLGITAKSKVFHSFRHLFKDLCRNAKIDSASIDKICGHEPGSVGESYGIGARVDVLAELITRIVPPVPVPRIFPPR